MSTRPDLKKSIESLATALENIQIQVHRASKNPSKINSAMIAIAFNAGTAIDNFNRIIEETSSSDRDSADAVGSPAGFDREGAD